MAVSDEILQSPKLFPEHPAGLPPRSEDADHGVGASILRFDGEYPLEVDALLFSIAIHTVPGAQVTDPHAATHTRLLTWEGTDWPVTIALHPDHVQVTAAAPAQVRRALEPTIRRWLDLDADTVQIERDLRNDDIVGPLVAARPGLRILGRPDGFEAAIEAILGQQVSLAAARTLAGRLVEAFGTPVSAGLSRFPTPAQLAAQSPELIKSTVRLTLSRAVTLQAVAEAFDSGLTLRPGGDIDHTRQQLLALPGIGSWTADYLTIRVLGDHDAFAPGDLVLRRALGGVSIKQAEHMSHRWSPHRAYALFHLWASQAPKGSDVPD